MMPSKNILFLFVIVFIFIIQGCSSSNNGSLDQVENDFESEDTQEGERAITGSGGSDGTSGQGSPSYPDLAEACIDRAFTSDAVDIGIGLPSGYEPSGADWHPRLNKLFSVHDNGSLFMMDKDGSDITTWNVGGDLEDITVPHPESDFVYIGREYPPAILEFNIEQGGVTRTFNLAPYMQVTSSQGLEALTFVEIPGNNEGGRFWVGNQRDGKIYVFELPILTSNISTTVTLNSIYQPVPSRVDLSGMDYSPAYNVVYVIYDANDRLTIVDTNGISLVDKNLPQIDQEGIAVNDLCDVFIAQDTNKKLWFYKGMEENIVINENIVRLLANRVSASQNDDGSYGWKHNIDEPLTPGTTGYQNVTGVSVWGFFGVIDLLGDESYWNPVANSVNYFDGRIDSLLANPHNVRENLSCPNYTVLSWYLRSNPDPVLRDRVINALNATLDARDSDYGTNPDMRVDGLFNKMIDRRSSIPGIIPWDMALCVEAFMAMSEISSDFSDDYVDSLTILADYLENTFLVAYDSDNTITYGDISLGMPLFVLAASQLSDSYADLIDRLTIYLESLVDETGMITNGSESDDGIEQPSAYGLLALKQVKSRHVQNVQNYLESRVDDQGHIYDPVTRLETFEVEGEVLRAITMILE